MIKSGNSRQRVLDPSERCSEVLFGLIMVLSFTGALSATGVSTDSVTKMLFGALGCNFAWGIIDAALYVMGSLATRGAGIATVREVRACKDPERARKIISDAIPPVLAPLMLPEQLDHIRQRIDALPEPSAGARMNTSDWRAAAGIFLLVFTATFPVALPFLLIKDAPIALRVSNGVALLMLFGLGFALGKSSGGRPLRTGIAMVVIGILLVGLTIAFGG